MVEQQAFRDATDAAADALDLPLRAIAPGFGVNPPAITQWRTVGSRFSPPAKWRVTLAEFVRQQAGARRRQAAAGDRLAAELDPDGSG